MDPNGSKWLTAQLHSMISMIDMLKATKADRSDFNHIDAKEYEQCGLLLCVLKLFDYSTAFCRSLGHFHLNDQCFIGWPVLV
jgi:hypothetical protein